MIFHSMKPLRRRTVFLAVFVALALAGSLLLRTQLQTQDPRNGTYTFSGEAVTLHDGSNVAADGTVTRYFGNEARADINQDGREDVVFLLTQDGGGSGTFYYVAAALGGARGVVGTNAVFIGDRIAPQSTEARGGEIVVNYADRYPWERFTDAPTVGKSKVLSVADGQLVSRDAEALTMEEARKLVIAANGGCGDGRCTQLSVNILDGVDGVWYVEAVRDGLHDDSVAAEKIVAQAHFVSGTWSVGAPLRTEYRCQPKRGQQEFSTALCL